MAVALILNVTHQRAFALRLFYAAAIVSAHFYFGLHASELKGHFYIDCGETQFLIVIAALTIRCEAAIPIAALAFSATLINAFAYFNYPAHSGIWIWYYSLINTIQCLQIFVLLTVSPVTIPWIRKFLTTKGNGPWVLRILEI